MESTSLWTGPGVILKGAALASDDRVIQAINAALDQGLDDLFIWFLKKNAAEPYFVLAHLNAVLRYSSHNDVNETCTNAIAIILSQASVAEGSLEESVIKYLRTSRDASNKVRMLIVS